MNFKWPKIIRDPIHNVISFDQKDQFLLDLINCKEFQRLRRIKQLGMSEFVFPGANHTRFAHSIGVMQTTKKFLHRIDVILDTPLQNSQRQFILAAALLHDVGHGPFSHAFEKITKDSHESRTLEIIRDPSTEVNKRLCAIDPGFPQHLGMFFDEDWEAPAEGEIIPSYLTEVVSSQLDGDRFDYLLRDSLATGTEYGRFDRDWIIEHFYVEKVKGSHRFFIGAKAFLPTEAYIFARYHMYRTVYFHKTTRAAEVMLSLIFKRFKELVGSEAGDPPLFRDIQGRFPPAMIKAFQGKLSLEPYLSLDDSAVSEFFKVCASSGDKVLQELGSGLLNRQLYKASELTEVRSDKVADFKAAIIEILQKGGADPEYHFAVDVPSDTPYKPYNPDEDKPAAQIYVRNASDRTVEISTISAPVAELRKKYHLIRYYYPQRFQTKVHAAAATILKD